MWKYSNKVISSPLRRLQDSRVEVDRNFYPFSSLVVDFDGESPSKISELMSLDPKR